ncbi:hypothetical protein LDENG_00283050, partial [Lucifuga dentata]
NKQEHLAKLVSSANEASRIFSEFHASDIGGHCGVEKTHSAIISRYYWPGMEGDIRKWIAQCPQCQAKRSTIKQKKEYQPIEVTEPLELVEMDLVGKLTPTEGGNQYICVMVDYFTKWAEAYSLKTKTADEINYGLCEKLGNKRSLCSPYHPQTNGLVQKLNGTIQRYLGFN